MAADKSESPEAGRTGGWDRAKSLSQITSAVVIPLVLLWIGNGFTSALKERELQGKFVELAVLILREEPGQQALGLREWATQVLDSYSGVPFSSETKKELIERTPLPSGPARYEGRTDLGNTEEGDGARFRGRGYLMIVGRADYLKYGEALGVDLASSPERAAEPKVAAAILALWFKEREGRYADVLARNDLGAARRITTGGLGNVIAVSERYASYLAAIETGGPDARTLSVPGVSNQGWVSEHLPALLAALHERAIGSKSVQAYALATADVDTAQGRIMTESTR